MDYTITAYRRIGRFLFISYLAVAGFAYVVTGYWGLMPRLDLLEAVALHYIVISPFPLLEPHGTYIAVVPRHPHELISKVMIVGGMIAIVASVGLLWSNRISYWVWVALLVVGGGLLLSYLPALMGPPTDLTPLVIPACLELSYVIAFLVGTRLNRQLG
jgi:hypothetical protein